MAATDNDEADAVNKIEAELGPLPKGVYADVVTRLNTLEAVQFNLQTGTTYTLVLGDASKCVVMSNVSANTLTVPPAASVAFPSGTLILVRQGAAGQTTIAGGAGVTIVSPYTSFKLFAQYAEVQLLKIGTNTWSVNGDVV